MASLDWQDSPQNAAPHRTVTSENNLWFGIAMALIGVVIGYAVGLFVSV